MRVMKRLKGLFFLAMLMVSLTIGAHSAMATESMEEKETRSISLRFLGKTVDFSLDIFASPSTNNNSSINNVHSMAFLMDVVLSRNAIVARENLGKFQTLFQAFEANDDLTKIKLILLLYDQIYQTTEEKNETMLLDLEAIQRSGCVSRLSRDLAVVGIVLGALGIKCYYARDAASDMGYLGFVSDELYPGCTYLPQGQEKVYLMSIRQHTEFGKLVGGEQHSFSLVSPTESQAIYESSRCINLHMEPFAPQTIENLDVDDVIMLDVIYHSEIIRLRVPLYGELMEHYASVPDVYPYIIHSGVAYFETIGLQKEIRELTMDYSEEERMMFCFAATRQILTYQRGTAAKPIMSLLSDGLRGDCDNFSALFVSLCVVSGIDCNAMGLIRYQNHMTAYIIKDKINLSYDPQDEISYHSMKLLPIDLTIFSEVALPHHIGYLSPSYDYQVREIIPYNPK